MASVQSLVRRLARYDPAQFVHVTIDEAHHAPAETYQTILAAFPAAQRLGLTATPDRLDKRGLGALFDTVAHVYDLRQAIQDGWLAPLTVKRVHAEIDLSRCRVIAGDLNEADLEAVMVEERPSTRWPSPPRASCAGRSCLVFAVTVAHATALAEVLARYVGPAASPSSAGTIAPRCGGRILERLPGRRRCFPRQLPAVHRGRGPPALRRRRDRPPHEEPGPLRQMVGRGTRRFPGKAELLGPRLRRQQRPSPAREPARPPRRRRRRGEGARGSADRGERRPRGPRRDRAGGAADRRRGAAADPGPGHATDVVDVDPFASSSPSSASPRPEAAGAAGRPPTSSSASSSAPASPWATWTAPRSRR